jgi:hypothetical protein
MGKLFVKFGEYLIKLNWRMKCKNNQIISKLLFDLTKCPSEGCECKK